MVVLNSHEPTASLKIPRLLSPGAEVFQHIRRDDVEIIKYLFRNGLASPNDVNGEYGNSLVYVG